MYISPTWRTIFSQKAKKIIPNVTKFAPCKKTYFLATDTLSIIEAYTLRITWASALLWLARTLGRFRGFKGLCSLSLCVTQADLAGGSGS